MSYEYDTYLYYHIANVRHGYEWMKTNIQHIFDELECSEFTLDKIISDHDMSKRDKEEYESYDRYFYGNKSYNTVIEFDAAWLKHQNTNKHHWQYWVLITDSGTEKLIEIPKHYIIEMICDWWSFSWKNDDILSIFKWYEDKKDTIRMHDKSREFLERVLSSMKIVLEESATIRNEYLYIRD